MKPEIIKHLSVMQKVCSMYCLYCKSHKYHYYYEKKEIDSESTTIHMKAECVKCETINWADIEIKLRKKKNA